MEITIFETNNYYVKVPQQPFIDRAEGGHLLLFPKVPVTDRTQLTPKLAIEYTKLSMIVDEASTSAMARRGIEIGIVNYQDMGNWGVLRPDSPTLHMHIYGRAKTATIQKYSEAVQLPRRDTGFYNNFQPLYDADIKEILADIVKLVESEKYSAHWSEQ